MEASFSPNPPLGARSYFEAKVRYSTGPHEVHEAIQNGRKVGVDFTIIDVRAAEDFRRDHIPGATNLPEEKWESLEGLARDKLNLVYCYTPECHLAARAAVEMAKAGYSVKEIDGGFEAWKDRYGFAVETGNAPMPSPSPGLITRYTDTNDGRYAVESLF